MRERKSRPTAAGSAMTPGHLVIRRPVGRDATEAREARTRIATAIQSTCTERNGPRAVPCLLEPGRLGDDRVWDLDAIGVSWTQRSVQLFACSHERGET